MSVIIDFFKGALVAALCAVVELVRRADSARMSMTACFNSRNSYLCLVLRFLSRSFSIRRAFMGPLSSSEESWALPEVRLVGTVSSCVSHEEWASMGSLGSVGRVSAAKERQRALESA